MLVGVRGSFFKKLRKIRGKMRVCSAGAPVIHEITLFYTHLLGRMFQHSCGYVMERVNLVEEHSMEQFTILPTFLATFFRKLPILFRDKHKLMLIWLMLLQAAGTGQLTLIGMSRHAPSHVTEWRWRRLLTAGYWSAKLIIYWLAEEVIKSLPWPENGIVYLIVDGSKKDKRGKQNPFNQKGKVRANKGWFFGIKFIVLTLSWKNFRFPIDFEIILPKKHKQYRKENELFRMMLARFKAPAWSKQVVILGDTAFASKANMNTIEKKNTAKEQGVFWGYVFALAKTWKKTDDTSIKSMVKHTKHACYKRTTISPITVGRNRSYWVFSKMVSLQHVGDVTIVLSKKRRNLGPNAVKVIVTNMLQLSNKEILSIYQRRFLIEVLFRELKSSLGLGKQQVTKNETRIQNSIAISLMSYLLLLKMQHKDIAPDKPWSIFTLQLKFRHRLMVNQIKHDCELEGKLLKNAA